MVNVCSFSCIFLDLVKQTLSHAALGDYLSSECILIVVFFVFLLRS
uniref:Uncharacterized protein n=1 Tax=Rhizophora mucronata TaxID=61149 RepID=A0A2P2QQK5_RHIMU